MALLKIDAAKDLPALPFVDSNVVRVGDAVIAIGSPFGFGWREDEAIKHPEALHDARTIVAALGAIDRHFEQLGVMPLEVLDNLCHASFGPSVVKLSGKPFPGCRRHKRKQAHLKRSFNSIRIS
jgi:hypothetical protein